MQRINGLLCLNLKLMCELSIAAVHAIRYDITGYNIQQVHCAESSSRHFMLAYQQNMVNMLSHLCAEAVFAQWA